MAALFGQRGKNLARQVRMRGDQNGLRRELGSLDGRPIPVAAGKFVSMPPIRPGPQVPDDGAKIA